MRRKLSEMRNHNNTEVSVIAFCDYYAVHLNHLKPVHNNLFMSAAQKMVRHEGVQPQAPDIHWEQEEDWQTQWRKSLLHK